jgi:hypothetical protein
VVTEIRAPYRDVRADQLSWAWGLAPRTPLARRAVVLPTCRLDVRLLGASHQVLAYGTDGLLCSETIACETGGHGRLPTTVTCSGADWRYDLRITVSAESATAFARYCEAITSDATGRSASLIGAFPGVPGAITAVVAEALPDGVAWRSWHCYPQTREIVATHSRFRAAP